MGADGDPPDQARAEMYLRFYGFRRVQDQVLQDDYPIAVIDFGFL